MRRAFALLGTLVIMVALAITNPTSASAKDGQSIYLSGFSASPTLLVRGINPTHKYVIKKGQTSYCDGSCWGYYIGAGYCQGSRHGPVWLGTGSAQRTTVTPHKC